MTTQTETLLLATQQISSGGPEAANGTKQLLSELKTTHTLPLWAQMEKLNPHAPNPSTIPYVWRYDELRPHLLRAGELISERQAERRVLMLVNPARGMC
jgi:gentisate 1,2-dioxygenase